MPDRPDLEEYVAHLNRRVQDEEGMVAESGDNFRLLYSGTRRLQYEGEILAMLQGEMDAMTAALGIFPDQPVDVLLLTDDLGERADPMDPLLQGLYDGRIRLFLGQGIGDRDKLLLTVRHEMVHALLHRAAGELPGWVQEGIAQKVGEDPDPARLREARDYVLRALKEGQDVDMGSLDNSFVQLQADERNLAYASSLLFMDFMTERYGNTFIPTFVWEMSQGTSAFNAVEKITGKGFAEIQAAFNRRLKEGS